MNKWVYKMCHPNLIRCPWWKHWQRNIFKNVICLYCPIEKWNAKAIVKGCRETGKKLLSNSMANSTAYLSHISDLPSKFFWVQGESSQKHLFFSMTSSIGLIVTRSQKPSSCLCVCESLSPVWLFATPRTVPTRLLCPWNSPGKNTGVDCHSLLQRIFPAQGSNPGLLQILYRLSYREVLQLSDSSLISLLLT